MQSCYGHFLYEGQQNPDNLASLPAVTTITNVEYKIAYIAFCIENSNSGRIFLERLTELTSIEPENIQLISPEWFWKRQVNSYALQVEPERFKYQDRATINYKEALHLETIRNLFYIQLEELIQKQHI